MGRERKEGETGIRNGSGSDLIYLTLNKVPSLNNLLQSKIGKEMKEWVHMANGRG